MWGACIVPRPPRPPPCRAPRARPTLPRLTARARCGCRGGRGGGWQGRVAGLGVAAQPRRRGWHAVAAGAVAAGAAVAVQAPPECQGPPLEPFARAPARCPAVRGGRRAAGGRALTGDGGLWQVDHEALKRVLGDP
jgi:hypothetical protein